MEKILYIVRGLPGSGKSTLSKTLVGKDYYHKEADMFFLDDDSNYIFETTKLKEAHNWCQEEIGFLMSLDHSPVIVSNTFTQEWEMKPYFDLAKQYRYKVFSIIVENRHGGVNEHDVSDEVLTKMRDRFEIKL